MKVLLINKFHYQRGGSETYYFSLAQALSKMGHEVIYFSMKDEKNLPCEQERYFVSNVDYNDKKQGVLKKLRLGFKIIYSFEAKHNIEELIQAERPDLAHIGLIHRQITFSVVDVLKKHHIPVVMSMHDLIFACPCYMMLCNQKVCMECMEKGIFSCVKKRCVKNSRTKSFLALMEARFLKWRHYYDKVDLYIAECEFYKKLMLESNFTCSGIITLPNLLSPEQEYKSYPAYEEYILYFGRFSKEKGILTLLEAYQILQNTECKLVLVGAGPLEGEVHNYIKYHKIDNVELKGAVYGEEMEHIIEKAKVIVVPSEWFENCPYSILTSMAKGKIIVASKIGGLPELIEDGTTGYLYEPGNPQDLSDKIKQAMALSREEYENMSLRVVEVARKKFSWITYIDRLIDIYLDLIFDTGRKL